MENFDWTSFTITIAVKAKIEDLYRAWASTSEIEKWFLKEAEYHGPAGNKIDKNELGEMGNTYFWRWFLYEETEAGEITEANGKDTFAFTFAGNCVVTIKLTESHDHTVVSLNQSNIPTDDQSKRNIRLGCHNGWSFYLLNLKSVYEGGLDLRNKDNRFKPMLNN